MRVKELWFRQPDAFSYVPVFYISLRHFVFAPIFRYTFVWSAWCDMTLGVDACAFLAQHELSVRLSLSSIACNEQKKKKKTRKLSWMVDNGFLHIGLTRPMNDMVMTDFGHGRLSILWPSRNWHGPIECGDVFQQARTRTLVLWQWMIDDTECWLVLYVLLVLVQSHAS